MRRFIPVLMSGGLLFVAAATIAALLFTLAPSQLSADSFSERECAELPPYQRSLCREVLDIRLTSHPSLLRSGTFFKDVRKLVELIRQLKPEVDYLCKVRNNGIIHCLSTPVLLAHLELSPIKHAIGDIIKIVEKYKLDERLIFKCQSGAWGSMPLGGDNPAATDTPATRPAAEIGVGNSISAKNAKKMLEICASLGSAGTDGTTAGVPGFSGLTGIDPNRGYCGFNIPTRRPSDKVREQALRYADELMKQCEYHIADTLKAGSDDPPPEDPPPEDPPPEDPPPEDPPPEDPPPEPTKDAGKQVIKDNGDGTETVEEYDADGNLLEKYTRPRSNTAKQIVIRFREDGTTVTERTNHDRSQVIRAPGSSRDARGTTWEFLVDSNGNTIRDVVYPQRRPHDCLDETCSTCKDFMQFNPELRASCDSTGSSFELCKQFTQTTECCANPNTFKVNPTIVIPNEGGDMVCYSADLDVQKKRCELT
ncbi:MAG: hypothetical protein OEU26_11650, partial [Candidatus Tectomicrobia bacterium]|nr:hypothetical protein [Candidatus Tectomicrobia bacterium]